MKSMKNDLESGEDANGSIGFEALICSARHLSLDGVYGPPPVIQTSKRSALPTPVFPGLRERATFLGNTSKELGAIRSSNLENEAIDERRDFREEVEDISVTFVGMIIEVGRFRRAFTKVRRPVRWWEATVALGEATGTEYTEDGRRRVRARFTIA